MVVDPQLRPLSVKLGVEPELVSSSALFCHLTGNRDRKVLHRECYAWD